MINKNEILVSVSCITYNHALYIRQCLEGFVIQKTTFPFEILIHDDASTDGTADIIREYEKRYPHLFKPIYQIENQYSKGVRISATYNFSRAKGKYIAMCEGDDYWTDPLKLQKQVDFLEKHPDYGLINSDVDVYYQEENLFRKQYNRSKMLWNNKYPDGNVSIEILLNGQYFIKTPTVLLRKSLYDNYVKSDDYAVIVQNKFPMGDTPLWVYVAQHSKLAYMDDVTTVYRRNINSVSNSGKMFSKLKFALASAELRMSYIQRYPNSFSKSFTRKIEKIFRNRLLIYSCYDLFYKSEFASPVVQRKIDFLRKYLILRSFFKCKILILYKTQSVLMLIYHKLELKNAEYKCCL